MKNEIDSRVLVSQKTNLPICQQLVSCKVLDDLFCFIKITYRVFVFMSISFFKLGLVRVAEGGQLQHTVIVDHLAGSVIVDHLAGFLTTSNQKRNQKQQKN